MKRSKSIKSTGKTVAANSGKVGKSNDQQRLQENEAIISKAQNSFLDSGKALKAIREEKLFEADGHEDFQAYCLKRWSYSRNYANRLITAYNCHETLKKKFADTGEALPSNEYQYRALASLNKAQWVKAWKQALANAAGKPVTGEMVESVVRKLEGADSESGKQRRVEAKSTRNPPEAKKLVKIGELVDKALENKAKLTKEKLLRLLVKIQQLAAE